MSDISLVAIDNADQAIMFMKAVQRFVVKQQGQLEEQIKVAADSHSSKSVVSAKY